MSENNFKSAKDYLKRTTNTTRVADNVRFWRSYFLSKFQNLIFYKNLPENIEAFEYTKNKILKGYTVLFEKNGKYHAPFESNAFGYDEYMIPNKVVYANPILGSGTLRDGENCVICWSTKADKLIPGTSVIWNIICRYSRMLAELESTFTNAMIFARSGLTAEAGNDTTARAFNEFIERLKTGDASAVVNKTMAFESLKPFNFNVNIDFTKFCETRDYLINCFWNEIGLQTLEEKKERMVTDEVDADTDILTNNFDIFYETDCENWDKFNKLFGTNVIPCKNKILGGASI